MTIKAIRIVLVSMAAALVLASAAEAAPRKSVRHRPKHSSRVSTGAVPAQKVQTTAKKSARARARSGSAVKARSTAKKSTAKRSTVKRRPATKPH
jgi:DNA-binding protein HU-beta